MAVHLSPADRASAGSRPLTGSARALVSAVLAAVVVCGGSAPAYAREWQWPLAGPGQLTPQVARPFDPPPAPWAAGHRGVDLAGSVGRPVMAPTRGVVRHAGPIAGRGVVVIGSGSLRTTLEPVTSAVEAGQQVRAGQVVGHLQMAGSHCLPSSCLHWGLLRGDDYLDPLARVRVDAEVVLLPLTGPPRTALPYVLAAGLTGLPNGSPDRRWQLAGGFPSGLGRTSVAGGAGGAIAFARAQIGDPYVWAASGPDSWDCSGLTMRAWAAAGRAIPRTSVAQQAATTPIPESELRPGDLVFWSVVPGAPSTVFHVGLSIGDGMMIHAPRPGTSVRVESIYAWAPPTFFGRI